MMKSLFAGVTGLKTHQSRMDVIGNNISNVNTVGYKGSSMRFQDLLYQTTQAATGPSSTGRAGTNARQIGLGAQTASIVTNIAQAGSPETTGMALDMYLDGDSFFMVSPDGSQNLYYTRAGAFTVDAEGTLCMASNGYPVMGYGTTQVDDGSGTGTMITAVDSSKLQTLPIQNVSNSTCEPSATTKAYMTGIVDQDDTDFDVNGKAVSFSFYDNVGYMYTANYYLTRDASKSPVEYTLTLNNIKDAKDNVVTSATGGSETSVTVTFNTKGTLYEESTTATAAEAKEALLSTKPLTFTFTSPVSGGTNTITVDYAELTNYANNKRCSITANPGASSADSTGSGWATGTLRGFNIGTDGTIYGTYTNGQTKLLGQIPVATFSNAAGLSKEGDNLYASTLNSGTRTISDPTAGGGKLVTGQLEMSNVDLAQEFTTMITTQRGFQANSRIITVSDTMLEELTNLKR